jgi:2,4-dienoyl-CoA reductase (NADPH2)
VSALRGIAVTVFEREESFGGMLRFASVLPGRSRFTLLAEWLEQECRLAGVELVAGHEASLEELDAHDGPVVCCTGSRPGRRAYAVEAFATVMTAAELIAGQLSTSLPHVAAAVVFDPTGGPIGIGVTELLVSLGTAVTFVTPDFVPGEQLSRTGDIAPASVRLQQAGVDIVRRSTVRSAGPESVTIEHRDSGEVSVLTASMLVDAGHRLPDDALSKSVAAIRPVEVAGDAVAPRTILQAVLEGRRVAMALEQRARVLA